MYAGRGSGSTAHNRIPDRSGRIHISCRQGILLSIRDFEIFAAFTPVYLNRRRYLAQQGYVRNPTICRWLSMVSFSIHMRVV